MCTLLIVLSVCEFGIRSESNQLRMRSAHIATDCAVAKFGRYRVARGLLWYSDGHCFANKFSGWGAYNSSKAWSVKLVWYRDILRTCFMIMGPNQPWVGTLKLNNFGWGKMIQTPCSSNPLNRSGYSSGIQQARNALGRSQECIIMMCKACWYALIWQMKSLLLDWTSGCKICNTTHLKK